MSGQYYLAITQTGDEILRHFLGGILAALAIIQFIYEGIRNVSM